MEIPRAHATCNKFLATGTNIGIPESVQSLNAHYTHSFYVSEDLMDAEDMLALLLGVCHLQSTDLHGIGL
jgi:hypothetical protein